MASYTIEDIELIRRKSGISYQEAVALLDYHNGTVARALVDLERNGRIKPEAERGKSKQPAKDPRQIRNRSGFINAMSRLYQARFKIKKGDVVIVNLSLLFSLVALLISPHLVIVGAIVTLLLGYRLSFDKHDPDFASANLEKMVRSASQNVKDSVTSMVQEFTGDPAPQAAAPKAEEESKPERSYYQGNPAATTYHATYGGSAPTIQVPVQVESQDGSVTLEADKDGFTEATIE